MGIVQIFVGFAAGFILGIGASLLYLRWKMKRQLGNLEEQMGQMMDMTDEMDEMVPEPSDSGESAEDTVGE